MPHGASRAGVTAVSWQAHSGEPVLDAFWAARSGTDVAITGSMHGALRFWSAAHLLEAACLQQPTQATPQSAPLKCNREIRSGRQCAADSCSTAWGTHPADTTVT